MTNAGSRRNDPQIIERLGAPLRELIAFFVPLHFEAYVFIECVFGAVEINADRVINNEVDRQHRINFIGIAAQTDHRFAHRRHIENSRKAPDIMGHDPGRMKSDIAWVLSVLNPVHNRLDIVHGHGPPVLTAQKVFQQDFHRARQAREIRTERFAGRLNTIIII